MNHQIKKIITILARRFDHVLDYVPEGMRLSDDFNEIVVKPCGKKETALSFNTADNPLLIKVHNDEIPGVLVELMSRKSRDAEFLNPGPVNESLFAEAEGMSLEECLDKLFMRANKENSDSFVYGGNMYRIEYYKGLAIISGIAEGFGTGVIRVKKQEKGLKSYGGL